MKGTDETDRLTPDFGWPDRVVLHMVAASSLKEGQLFFVAYLRNGTVFLERARATEREEAGWLDETGYLVHNKQAVYLLTDSGTEQ